jgi:hypothetical protein
VQEATPLMLKKHDGGKRILDHIEWKMEGMRWHNMTLILKVKDPLWDYAS